MKGPQFTFVLGLMKNPLLKETVLPEVGVILVNKFEKVIEVIGLLEASTAYTQVGKSILTIPFEGTFVASLS